VSRLQAVAVGAQHPQVFEPIISRIAIDVIKFQREPPIFLSLLVP